MSPDMLYTFTHTIFPSSHTTPSGSRMRTRKKTRSGISPSSVMSRRRRILLLRSNVSEICNLDLGRVLHLLVQAVSKGIDLVIELYKPFSTTPLGYLDRCMKAVSSELGVTDKELYISEDWCIIHILMYIQRIMKPHI